MVWLCLIACMRNQRVSDKVLTQLTSTGLIPNIGEIITAHHFDGLRTTAGLVGCRVVVVVVKRACLLRAKRRNFIKANSRFVVSVGTQLIGRGDPLLDAWNSWQEHFWRGDIPKSGKPRSGDQLVPDGHEELHKPLQLTSRKSLTSRNRRLNEMSII